MLLKLFWLTQQKITSNASRKISKFVNFFCIQSKFKRLTIRKFSNAGRASNGKIVVWTKSSLKKKNTLSKINYKFNYNKLGFISSFQILPFKNKLLSLIIFSNGWVTYFITTDKNRLFIYFYQNKIRKIRKLFKHHLVLPLFKIKKLSFVCLLELLPSKFIQYCRSSGTKGKILKFETSNQTALIQLPSKARKFFSCFSQFFLGEVALKEKRYVYNTKSGYWRNFGIKPIVRGVAMNPVDHPHGGRTKTIKCPRTPWGKITKYK